jgi:hypothetical protein
LAKLTPTARQLLDLPVDSCDLLAEKIASSAGLAMEQ